MTLRRLILLTTAATLTVLLLLSCSNQSIERVDTATIESFTASMSGVSRTSLGNDNAVLWSSGDKIAIVSDAQPQSAAEFTLEAGADTKDGVFIGEVLSGQYYHAFYPYSALCQVQSDGSFLFSMPTEAVYTEKNFVSGANPMCSTKSSYTNLEFYNIFGIVCFKIAGSGTITNIEIVSKDNSQLSGKFYVSPVTLEVKGASERYSYVYARLEEPITLSSEAVSIYAVLPVGEYNNLIVRTLDNSGILTERVSTAPITVQRSTITSVSKFNHTTYEAPYISVTSLEEKCTFNTAICSFDASDNAEGFAYFIAEPSQYESYAQSMTDSQILLSKGNSFAENHTTHQSSNSMVILAAPKKDGSVFISGLTKQTISPKPIPYSDALSVCMEGSPQITSNSFKVNLIPSIEHATVLYSFLPADNFNGWRQESVDRYLLLSANVYTKAEGDSLEVAYNALLPDTEYCFYYAISNGEQFNNISKCYTSYSKIESYSFRTATHTPSNATVTFEAKSISSNSATFDVILSGAEGGYSYFVGGAGYPVTSDIINIYGTRKTTTDTTLTVEGLQGGTEYSIYAVAYDANGIYGAISTHPFTTPTTE